MKRIFFFSIIILFEGNALFAQNIGIGTLTPLQRLHVKGTLRIDPIGTTGNSNINMYSGTTNDVSSLFFYNQLSATSPSVSFGYNSLLDNSFWSISGTTLYLKNEGLGISNASPLTKLHILGGQDASLTNHGYIVTGSTTGPNLVIDNNEIMARNDGSNAKLFLQADGGETEIGNGAGTFRFTEAGKLQQPSVTGTANLLPVAYGKVSPSGIKQSGTFFLSSREAEGVYRITVLNENNMLTEEDQFTILVTPYNYGGHYVSAKIDNATSFIVRTSKFQVPYINKNIVDACGVPCDYTLASYITSFPTSSSSDAGFSFLVYKN